ncbi:MAG: class III extradiol ring-cleavage dioxygenase [Burkholderiaceae bacterium]
MGKILYIPHGGGPMPLLGHPGYARLSTMLRSLNDEVAGSTAIVVVTAHWEADRPALTSAERPGMLFDYYGFPPETYDYDYPAPGAAALAGKVAAAMREGGFSPTLDDVRGYDHGVFVPMMLIRPEADIPVLQMSLISSLDAAQHLALGRCLAGLMQDDITVIGSGFSFHNLGVLTGRMAVDPARAAGLAEAFHRWLDDTICNPAYSDHERAERLAAWAQAPGARFCHPREEHLLPLHVCFGAAAGAGMRANQIFGEPVQGFQTSGYAWRQIGTPSTI